MSSTPVNLDRVITVALIGGGTVGTQVARLLTETANDLRSRVGASVQLTGVAVRDLGKARPGIDPTLLTDDSMALARSGADIVVEVMGGIDEARALILAAMEAGSSVVTANKALLAADGATLYAAAARNGVDLYFEGSVAGAIPLIRPLRESLAGDRVTKVLGIVNGTTNYMLTKMDEQNANSSRPTPRSMSTDTMPPRRPRSSRSWHSTPASPSPMCIARGFPRSPSTMSTRRRRWASSSSFSRWPS